MKTGAPVLPVYFVRKGFLRYVIRCNEPLEMERKGNIEELIRKNTRKINAFLETLILENPDEWFWVHQRWERQKIAGLSFASCKLSVMSSEFS